MNPKISIICPVYNVEKFINKCVDSIIEQTFKDWELILVDDGSPDFSGRICDKYAANDDRIRVIHQENGGVSAARQAGMEAASGEYIIHVDPDDWVEPEMLEGMYIKAKNTGADIVICDYFINEREKETYRKQEPTTLEPAQVLKDLFQQLLGSCCNKLVRRACYSKYNISFPENINYCEDLLVCVQLFRNDDLKVTYLPKAFYHYRMNATSITHQLTRNHFEELLKYLDILKVLLPGEEYRTLREKAALGVFNECFIGRVMTDEEIVEMFKKVKPAAFSSGRGLRWKLGYIMIDLRLYYIAHLLIKY